MSISLNFRQSPVTMIRRFSLLFISVLTLVAFQAGVASAQDMLPLDLPPGIVEEAQPLLEAMMQRMQDSGMSHEQMQMMMADMQTMADQLPPGIFLEILQLMSQLEMSEMMYLHQQMHQGGLLQRPPGQILELVQELAQ